MSDKIKARDLQRGMTVEWQGTEWEASAIYHMPGKVRVDWRERQPGPAKLYTNKTWQGIEYAPDDEFKIGRHSFLTPSPLDTVEVVSYISDIDGAAVVEINYPGHLRVIVGEGTVFDQETKDDPRIDYSTLDPEGWKR